MYFCDVAIVPSDPKVFIDLTVRMRFYIYNLIIFKVEPIKAKIIAGTSLRIELDKINIFFL